MAQLIDKSALVTEIERRIKERDFQMNSGYWVSSTYMYEDLLDFLDTLEVKESLTWEDIRKLYIIFAEVDVDIEFFKITNIKPETIGYYQEVLKRFKAQKILQNKMSKNNKL